MQGSIGKTTAFRSSIRTVRGDVDLAESTLASATDVMNRAHEISLQGASGQLSAAERQDLALEVGHLREQLLGLANTKGSQGYLFGGTKTSTPPFDAAAAFVGDDLDRKVETGPGIVSTVSTSGAKAFTAAGGDDVFAVLKSLQTALNANDATAVQGTVNSLDSGARQILAARIDAGLKLAKLDTADTAHEQTNLALATQQSALIDVNPAEAYSRLAQTQQGVEQAVSVTKNMLDTLRSVQF